MNKKLSSILLVSYIGLTLGGCGLFQQSEEPPVAQSPQPLEEETSEEETDEVFEEPTTTGSTPQLPSTAGLIPSTPPSERKKSIKPGRDNPFSVIPIQPVVREKTASNGVSEPERFCQIEEVQQPTQPTTTIAQAPSTATPVSDVGLPPLLDPVLPIPNEARGVVVSGVLQLNGTPVAIVKAPNENVARQVTVGASLSNGQVTVKSINVSSQKPYIVLEQYGLEIPRSVGEPAEEPIDPPTPTPPSLPDGTPQPPSAAPAPVASSPTTPPGPNGFGKVKDLVLLTLNIRRNRANGIICNAGFNSVTVNSLKLQIEDQTTGSILDSIKVSVPEYNLAPGQKAEFDSTVPDLRGREQGNVNIELVGWE